MHTVAVMRPGRWRSGPWVRALSALLVLSSAGCTGAADSSPTSDLGRIAGAPTHWKQVPAKEMPLPNDLPSLRDGGRHQVDSSKPVLVNFWASWCGACKQELPWLQRLADQGDVTVIGVTRDRYPKYALGSLAKANATYDNRVDAAGEYVHGFRGLLPPGLPHSVLIVDGEVRAVHVGPFASWRELRRGATRS